MLVINDTPIIVDMETVLTLLADEMKEKFGREYFGKPIRSGNNIMIKCPFHKEGQERSSSLGVRIDDGRFNCFTCEEGGTFDLFIAKCLRLGERRDENNEVIVPAQPQLGFKWLLQKFNLAVQGERPELELDLDRGNKSFKNFVAEVDILKFYQYTHPYMEENRKVPQKTQDYLEIGYDKETNSVIFLMRDLKGNIVYVKKRPISSNLRYANVKDVPKKHLMFGMWYIYRDLYVTPKDFMAKLIREKGITLVEGEIDSASSWVLRMPGCSIGGRILFDQQVKVLHRLGARRLRIALDNDEYGQKETKRIVDTYSSQFRLDIVKYPDWAKDMNDVVKEGCGEEVLTIT